MSYTSSVAMPVVRCLFAEGKLSLPADRGRFVGGALAWDDDNRRFRDYAPVDLNAQQLADLSDEELSNYQYLRGVVHEPALQAAMLAWQIAPHDIDLAFWLGPEFYNRETGRMERPRSLPTDPAGPMWRIIRPGGNPGTTLLQQYNTREDLDYTLSSYAALPADPCFSVRMYREASSSPATAGSGVPYIHTGVTFGGCWHVRFPKWRPAELLRRVGGKWTVQSTKEWSGEELYGDSYGSKELVLTVMGMDGAILIKSSLHGGDGAWVQELPGGGRIQAAPISFCGNGGAAWFGLNGIDFAQGWWNCLVARSRTDLDLVPQAMPERITTGSKPAGTRAQALMLDDRRREITTPRRSFWHGLRLESEDGTNTPVVRLSGLNFAPRTTAPELQWLEIAEGDFVEATGGWRVDILARTSRQQYDIRIRNDHGQYAHFVGNRMLALEVGRPGSEAAGLGGSWDDETGPLPRVTSLVEIIDLNRQGYRAKVLNLRTISIIDELDQVEIGWRPPLDGLTVAEAIRRILGWCNIGPAQIGTIHDSGRRLPSSSFAVARALSTMSSEVRGALDTDSAAACQLRDDLTGLAALQWAMQFDFNTFLAEDEMGRINYTPPGSVPVRHFSHAAEPVAENEIRRELTVRPRIGEGKTSVRVQGRERSTGRPLSSRAFDREALTSAASARFRGIDTTHRVEDDRLIKQQLCDERCRFEYEWLRRLRDGGTFTVIGQQLYPLWMVDIVGENYWVVAVEETIRRTGWEMSADLVAVG